MPKITLEFDSEEELVHFIEKRYREVVAEGIMDREELVQACADRLWASMGGSSARSPSQDPEPDPLAPWPPGSFVCKDCPRTFYSDRGLASHRRAKHVTLVSPSSPKAVTAVPAQATTPVLVPTAPPESIRAGAVHPSRFSEEQRAEMRRLYDSGVSQKEIGTRFGTTQTNVSRMIREDRPEGFVGSTRCEPCGREFPSPKEYGSHIHSPSHVNRVAGVPSPPEDPVPLDERRTPPNGNDSKPKALHSNALTVSAMTLLVKTRRSGRSTRS
jgi:hypothetical protein